MTLRDEKEEVVRKLLETQLFGVLATQSGKSPYCSLLAFAATGDLTALLFATSRETTKYANVVKSGVAALLVDNRPPDIGGIAEARAVTAIGTVNEVENEEREYLLRIFLDKHPTLMEFVKRNDSALMKLHVEHYIVAGFDGTARLTMKR